MAFRLESPGQTGHAVADLQRDVRMRCLSPVLIICGELTRSAVALQKFRRWERDMDGNDIDRQRLPWAVRFSLTMHALNPGVQILLRWLRWIVVLIGMVVAVWSAPGALSWLG